MRSITWPDMVEIVPGQSGFISVAITNTSPVIDAFEVQVLGLDPEWVSVTPDRLSLFPGQTENVGIQVTLPHDYPASRRALSVNVSSDDDPEAFVLSEVELDVQPRTHTTIRVDPTMVTGGRKATFGMVVSNVGNAAVQAVGYGIDPEELAEFTFQPPSVIVAPGREQVIEVTVSGGRTWFGQPRARVLTLGVEAEQQVEAIATFIQRPRIGRWLMALLGLLTAAAVFAVVLSRTFDRVVDEARVSSDVLNAALERNEAGGAVVPSNPGGVTGTITSSTNDQGIAGAQAELFVADDPDSPIASAATDDAGTFTFAQLGAGSYLLRLSGSGVGELWYPNAASPADATAIDVALGEVTALDPITIGGIPVTVTGVIDVDDPTGVVVSLVAPGGDAVVASVELAPDGSFALPDIPSPGSYQLVVEQPGAPPQQRDIVLEPGRALGDVAVTVQPGGGKIVGMVFDHAGQPLGGATVTATDGSTEVSTVTLTESSAGSALGSYTLHNLPIPGQYTVTIERDGYAPESRTVSLIEPTEGGTTVTGTFDARLMPAIGSISGHVSLDGEVARGLTVTVNGGDVDRTVAVVSQGADAGSYRISGLPVPGTYTLNFAGPGTVGQVRVVDLDPAGVGEHATGVDVSLVRALSVVRGVVRDAGGAPVARATIVLSNGTDDRSMLSADEPIGQFEFSNVTPGAYTLTASRTGTEPVVVLVNVATTGSASELDLQLGAQASVSGSVTGFDTAATSLPVRLFEPGQFPSGNPVATVHTDAAGLYSFTGLDAPANFVVAVYAGDSAADPLDSATVSSAPSLDIAVPTFTVQIP